MKIKIYIITYKNQVDLEKNINSLIASDLHKFSYEVNIINNHSNFQLSPRLQKTLNINVYHNTLRPDFSTGHLSRNWNEAIVNGFKDLNHPDANIVVACQDDTFFKKDAFTLLTRYHKTYSFISDGTGDTFCSYTPEAIKNIGLWDERFANIGFQEADFFMRALMFNKQKSSINDYEHGRLLHPIPYPIITREHRLNFTPEHLQSTAHHCVSLLVFKAKYGRGYSIAEHWTPQLIANPPTKILIPSFMHYPYFEKNINDLIGKGYITAGQDNYLHDEKYR